MAKSYFSTSAALVGFTWMFLSLAQGHPLAFEDVFPQSHPKKAYVNVGQDLPSISSRGPIIREVKPGQYQLNDTIYNPFGDLWVIPPGANITGGLLEGNTDGSTILPGHEGIALIGLLKKRGGSTVFVSNAVDGQTDFAPYEADGIYTSVATSDPSVKSNHDMVAGHFSSKIERGNLSGRVWGQDINVTVPAGADGYAVGQEIGIGNDSQTTGNYGQNNAKLGLSIIAAGTTDSTAGLLLHDAGARFVDGLLIFTSALRKTAFRLTSGKADLAVINTDGTAKFTGLTVTGPVKLMTRTVRTLPVGCSPGQEIFVYDGRNPGETVGKGSGTVAFCNHLESWLATSTGGAVLN